MSCEECGGPLPIKPYVWTSWSDTTYDFIDHTFCSSVCRDQWLQHRLLARCHRCGKPIAPDDVVFKYSDIDRRSLAYHRDCC